MLPYACFHDCSMHSEYTARVAQRLHFISVFTKWKESASHLHVPLSSSLVGPNGSGQGCPSAATSWRKAHNLGEVSVDDELAGPGLRIKSRWQGSIIFISSEICITVLRSQQGSEQGDWVVTKRGALCYSWAVRLEKFFAASEFVSNSGWKWNVLAGWMIENIEFERWYCGWTSSVDGCLEVWGVYIDNNVAYAIRCIGCPLFLRGFLRWIRVHLYE